MITFETNVSLQAPHLMLPAEVVQALPRPLAESFRQIKQETNPHVQLQLLCFALIPLTFQYCALIFSSEYLLSTAPPDNDVTESLWGMIRRSGPGKWAGFLREAVRYFLVRETQVIPRATLEAVAAALLDPKRPRVKQITMSADGSQHGQRLDYFEALINMRNRFAHSRQVSLERTVEFYTDHLQIWMRLILLLATAFTALRLLIAENDRDRYQSGDQRAFDPATITPSQAQAALILLNPSTGRHLKLLPLVIPFYEEKHAAGEALLLEEVKGQYVLYLYKEDYLKRKEEFLELMRLLNARTVKAAQVSSEELTAALLGARIDALTKKTLTALEDARKYAPAMFVDRPALTVRLDEWVEAEQSGCILVGGPGVGKTSLIAGWCIQRRDRGDHVLLLEAAKLPEADLPKILADQLGLVC